MQKIRILPENLCNKIAAGEVVERPASVVKELVENSLDAGATEIRLEIERGGKKLIRIVDDGEGMNRDDAFLCLERHGTSKISSDEDLFNLNTLGFRGEALPSIGAVSRMTLRTSSDDTGGGYEIYSEGGVVKRAGEVGLPRGTTIEVRDLFFNTPGRRKFLRKDETEFGHIADVVSKLALAYSDVQFSLVHNGRSVIEVYRQKEFFNRVAALLGRPLVKDLISVDVSGGEGLHLEGLVSQPGIHRSTTGSIYCFINGRFIKDRVVQHALMEAYRNLMPKGRYPVLVLFLQIDPAIVDVNVHPTKHEVRFRDQKLVHDFITSSIRDALRPSDYLAEPPKEVVPEFRAPVPSAKAYNEPSLLGPSEPAPAFAVDSSPLVKEAVQNYRPQPPDLKPEVSSGAFVMPEPAIVEEEKGFFSSLEILGQYHRSYILCQDGEDLVLVDQHAGHERVGFEKLKSQFLSGQIQRQSLLFPKVIEVDYSEVSTFENSLDDFLRLGFEVEHFGGRAFALKATPHILGEVEAEGMLKDVASELVSVGNSGLIEEALDEILILMACHSVIRANQSLSIPEIKALFKELDSVDFNAHCPHGRPVMKRLSLIEVERMFKRA